MVSRLIHVDLFFKLPQGFDGGFDDLLMLILKYRANNGNKEPMTKDYVSEVLENNSVSKSGHDILMIKKLLSSETRNLMGSINVIEVSDKDKI